MKRRSRVVWSKGMFLTPQHFQAQDRFFEDSLHFRFAASQFANWGVADLEIDREAAKNGLVRINRGVGIMPDGELFDMPAADELPPSRSFAEQYSETTSGLDIYLALPEHHHAGRNIAVPASNGAASNARFVAEARMVPDDNEGEEQKEIQIAKRNFRLLFGNEHREGFTSFRIAQIMRNSAGVPILNDSFVAPCIDFSHSEFLMGLLRRQIEILANRIGMLNSGRRQRDQVLADFTASGTAYFWLLHTMNSCLPELRHLYRVRRGHPEAAWLAMLRLAGALSTFSLDANAGDLPDYDHDDLGRCFAELDHRIRNLMDNVIKTNYVPIPLTLSDRFIWSGTVADDRYFRNSQFYLAVSAKMGIDDIIRKVPQLVKVSSNNDIQKIIRNALAGVTLRHTPTPPAAVPVKLDNQYFSLNQTGALWENIQLSRSLAVFAPSEIADPKLEMIVVLD